MVETVTIAASPAGTPPGVIVQGDLGFLIGRAASVGGNAGAG